MNYDEYNESNSETITSLLHTIALIREAAGVNEKPMLSELPDVIRKLRKERNEARRQICEMLHEEGGRSPEEWAERKGWNCFWEPFNEDTDV